VNEPAALFADEPTGNLDSAAGKQVLALLRAAADSGRAVLLVTHDRRAAAQVADRVLELVTQKETV
jgi:putative ABC transport system ATP-binding protein